MFPKQCLHKLYDYCLGKFMYSHIYEIAPVLFLNEILINSDVHQYNTRSAKNAHVQFFRTEKVKNSFVNKGLNKGPLYWCSLPENITTIHCISTFNRRHKNYMLCNSG